MPAMETPENQKSSLPDLLFKLETPDYQLFLRLAEEQIECWADYLG
ncbi:hypothetical protein [Malonomonas rubra]|nr:hypothetical protein [Malonomonas rubra]